ncbi:MAG: AbgT family transporter [Acidimicrobiia bacterium]|jgi:aminobenzoyl-glutamate transport protein
MTTDAVAVGKRSFNDRLLTGIERAGNRVPHPVIMFLYLIGFIAVLSAILAFFEVSVTEEIVVPVPKQELADLRDALGGTIIAYDVFTGEEAVIPDYVLREETIPVRSLLSVAGIRFFFSSIVNNLAAFGVIAVILIAMAGVGVAETSGFMAALIRKLVAVAPRQLIAFILIFIGVLSSVATDAGYLILIPLAASAFLVVGRHPVAGVAASFAGVSAIFAVNLLITPTDAMVTEITNEAIGTGGEPISITANFYFSAVSSVVLALVAMVVTTRMIEPRLGPYDPAHGDPAWVGGSQEVDESAAAAEARGLRHATWALVVFVLVILAVTLPPGAPLRDPATGAIIGPTPFMSSLIFIISMLFLVTGFAYGVGAKTMTSRNQAIEAVTKTYAGLAGLIFMLVMIAQFIAFFNYTNIPRVLAVEMAYLLERAGFPALPLLVGFILVIVVLNFIIPGVVPKWAIFAPVFIPIFTRLDIAPQTLLAAYRIGDGPTNVLTPLMVYLPFILTVTQRYKKDAGLGTVVAMMLPYTLWILVAWIALFVVWFLLGIPLGPGAPVGL